MKTKILDIIIGILVLIHLLMALPAMQDAPRFQLRDSYDYLDLARTLLSTSHYKGTEYPGVDLLRPPGYPVFLLIWLWLGRDSTGLISLAQVFLMLVTCWILYRIFAEIGHRQVGWMAVLFYLLNPNATFWSMVILTETLAGFFLVLTIWFCVRFWITQKRRWLFFAGLSLSAGALTRPIFLPLAIGIGVLFFLVEWIRSQLLKPSLTHFLIFMLGFLILVIPWHFRNLQVHGRFTLSEVGDSTFQNWYIAKTLAAAQGISRDDASAIIATSPNPMQYSLEVIRQYPLIFIKEQARGIIRSLLGAEYGTWAKVWGGQEISTTGVLSAVIDIGSPSEIVRSLASQAKNPWFWAGIYAAIYDITLYTAMIFGVWRVLRRHRQELVFKLVVIIVFSLIYLLIIPGAAGESRFRVPADPLLVLAAGLAFLPPGTRKLSTVKKIIE